MTTTVTAVVESNNVPPRVKVTVTDTGTPVVSAVQVTRVQGADFANVRTLNGELLPLQTSGSNRVGIVYDYEMPFGAAVRYSTAQVPTAISAAVTVPSTSVWLIHPTTPGLSMPVKVAALEQRTRRNPQGVFNPIGRANPIVVNDGRRKAPEGVLQLRTSTDAQRVAMDALLADGRPLLLNVPSTLLWGLETSYIAVGDVEESRVVRYGPVPHRLWNLPYKTVPMPAGGQQSQRTFADVLAENATFAQITQRYATFADLLAGTPI